MRVVAAQPQVCRRGVTSGRATGLPEPSRRSRRHASRPGPESLVRRVCRAPRGAPGQKEEEERRPPEGHRTPTPALALALAVGNRLRCLRDAVRAIAGRHARDDDGGGRGALRGRRGRGGCGGGLCRLVVPAADVVVLRMWGDGGASPRACMRRPSSSGSRSSSSSSSSICSSAGASSLPSAPTLSPRLRPEPPAGSVPMW